MMVLLDSTVLIDTLRSRDRSVLRQMVNSGHQLATSAVNIAEIYAGMRPHEAERAEILFEGIDCYPVTAPIARRAGLLINHWRRRGKTLGIVDAILAATAIEHGLPLMTANRKDFPMPELTFYPPDT